MSFRHLARAASQISPAPRAALLLALLASLCLAVPVQADEEHDKTIYFIGLSIARSLATLNLDEKEIKIVAKAIQDASAGKGQELDPEVYGPKLQALQQERAAIVLKLEEEKSSAYLEKMAARDGADVRPSGLIITHTKEGTGAAPETTSKVRVAYTGKLRDGSVFDKSTEGQPAEFPLNGVIPCWTEGVSLMKVGGKAQLVCPAEIAYKAQGAPPVIPPGAALTFDVELIDIVQ